MSTFFAEAESYGNLSTAKDVGLMIVGVYGSNKAAGLVPFGGNSGWGMALKTGLAAVLAGWVGDRFLGAREGRDLASGGLLLAGFEALNAATKGKYGAFPTTAMGGGSSAPALAAGGGTNAAASAGYGQQPLVTQGVTIPTTQGLANNASGVASGFSSGTGL